MIYASDLEIYMLELINAERTSRGLNPLKLEINLNKSAGEHSAWMLDANVFSHTGEGNSSASQRMREAGFDFSGSTSAAENIAIQSARGTAGYRDDVKNLHDALMNSSGHRANILNPSLEYIGIGIEIGSYTYSSNFTGNSVIVTQNFARTQGSVDLDDLRGDDGVVVPEPSNGPDVLNGSSGHDMIQGLGGADKIFGHGGNDTLLGGGQSDTLYGAAGRDKLNGGSGNDTLFGGSQNDSLIGSTGRDELYGGRGSDTLLGGDQNDKLFGSAGGDRLNGGNGSDLLRGGAGSDVLMGSTGADTLFGGNGNDRLFGGQGNDQLFGQAGSDTFVFKPASGNDTIKGGFDVDGAADIIRILSITDPDDVDIRIQGQNTVFDFGNGSVVIEDFQLDVLGWDFEVVNGAIEFHYDAIV